MPNYLGGRKNILEGLQPSDAPDQISQATAKLS